MAISSQQLRDLFALPPGSDRAINALQRFDEPSRRILLAVRGLRDYANLPVPGDLGFGILKALDQVYSQHLSLERTDRAWLIRAAACLLGLVVEVRAAGVWEAPNGMPIFMALAAMRHEAVLFSPLRLAIDVATKGSVGFHRSYGALLAFHNSNRPMPEHIFRVDPTAIPEGGRANWQWAWSLVAVCGRYHNQHFDLDFTATSILRAGQLVVRGEPGLDEATRLALQATDHDQRRRETWLALAVSAYFGEVCRIHLKAHWRIDPRVTPSRTLVFPTATVEIDVLQWVRLALTRGDETLLLGLVQQLALARLGKAPWPSLE